MNVNVELLTEADFGTIVGWVNQCDEDFLIQWAGPTYTFPLTVEQMQCHYHKGINSLDADVFLYKIISTDNNNEMIGSLQLCRFDPNKHEAVIGRFLIGEANDRGSGLGTIALKKAVKIGFKQFGLRSIRLNVFDINHAAIRCYERVGFEKGKITENVHTSSKGVQWNNIEMIINNEAWHVE
ncbi:GNAT family N-acetyltransferase [Paenibacillus sp. MMS18-CY102]|uniref:GNAT family N-acetyltransferase n=1 Tax=Paenibacillus sp. MMS18-CY102 TaxID=2682849 RepID=UPI00136564E8|nr:GNAT family protein [Paenibacillus sp. MMS18-CY102]MWC29173.1 GNAT family N-acetyltransferase [Paenibacillus sp. MMS18-CY102]